jgi:hypothetical protein
MLTYDIPALRQTFMKGEEWRLFLSILLKSDKFSDFFDIVG